MKPLHLNIHQKDEGNCFKLSSVDKIQELLILMRTFYTVMRKNNADV